jgi:hypothetical protein
VTISLDEGNKKIIFRKSIDKYELPYEPVKGDRLFPIAVLYYPDDEVEVLPDFI